MMSVTHFVAGGETPPSAETQPIISAANGEVVGRVSLASDREVDAAVAAARAAAGSWRRTSVAVRAELMLELRNVVKAHREELAEQITRELGKTRIDALAEPDRGAEALAAAANIGPLLSQPAVTGASTGIDVMGMRQPLGVIATVSPFNFPAMIPIVQSALAIAAGNTVVCKPSERNPSAALLLAQLYRKAGLPAGVFNVINGDRRSVQRLLAHPDVDGVSFVGSSTIARQVREAGVLAGKRVQAFGGGKNHLVVMPDADVDLAADAAISSAFGAAGQRCMAVSVVVAVGDIADKLAAALAARASHLKTGAPSDPQTQMGPLVDETSRERLLRTLATAEAGGGRVLVDGRVSDLPASGAFLGPCIVDYVEPGSPLHREELFGPVLSVVRVADYEAAVGLISDHQYGNGAAIFTRDGATARRFMEDAEAGCVGINVPIPFPVFYHNFGGWKDSAFTDTKLFGPAAIDFCTLSKTVVTRWPNAAGSSVELAFPTGR